MSVVVPTLNRGGELVDSLSDLLKQDYRPLEIVVVDQSDKPSAELAQLVKEHSDVVRWHRVSFRGLPRARNYGWLHARYDMVLFVDDDIRCGPRLVTEHAQALHLPGVAVVAGGIDEAHGEEPSHQPGKFDCWTCTPARGFYATADAEVDHAPGGNFSAWRSVLEELGGIDELFQVGAALYEETDFCLRVRRVGYRVYFSGRARLTHLAVGGGGCRVRDVVTYVYGLGHNRAVLMRRHLRWYHLPSALVRLALLGGSYAIHYRSPGVLPACIAGSIRGFRAGGGDPACTQSKGQLA